MLILGIDPGTATSGYGLINFHKNTYEAIGWGLIETEKNGIPEKRLLKIHQDLISNVLKVHNPDVMAIEKIFFATNAKTAIQVGQAQGAFLIAAAMHNIEVVEYAPGTIKKTVTGNGRADKKEMQKSVRKLLGAKIRSKKRKKTHFDNEADALAVALCHALTIKN